MLVCTLPSPACMCSATNTRPCSTRLMHGVAFGEHGREGGANEDACQFGPQLGASS